jgi:hypothetical protein
VRVTDDRILWKGTALKQFALFPTINSERSNAAELRRLSCHVIGFRIKKTLPMTDLDVAPEHPNLNEWCEHTQGVTPRRPPARGPADAESKSDLHLKCNDTG